MTALGATATSDQRTPADRERNVARCLRILRGVCGSRITPSQIGYRENWSARSVMSYLRELERDGHAELIQQSSGRETSWRITEAGKAYLHSVTGGAIGARFDLHPAPMEGNQ